MLPGTSRWLRALALVLLLLVPVRARAQDDDASTNAQALFDRALDDLEHGRFDTACPRLAESHRLDPLLGVLFTLAECEASWGKLATAVSHYDQFLHDVSELPAAQRSKHARRERVAQSRKNALTPLVPHLTLVLPRDAPKDTVVQTDGVGVRFEAMTGLAVDPGQHVIVTTAPGRARREKTLLIARGGRERVELEVAPPEAPPSPRHDTVTVAPPIAVMPSNMSSVRPWMYVAGGIAVALLAGGLTGALAIGEKATVDDHCAGPACDAEGKAAADRGKTLAIVSTTAFAVSLVGVALMVYLLVTDPVRKSAPSRSMSSRLRDHRHGGTLGLSW